MDLQTAFDFVLGGLMALLGLVWKAQDKRIDRLEQAVGSYGKDLSRLDAQHDSVLERLDRIESKLDRVLEER